ncbi:hypothetical protein HY500_02125 [Candidatus Woesearchaeota archaeon]|nr:hypothetical protein [Candidatus Woesearchaeota archaeon]
MHKKGEVQFYWIFVAVAGIIIFTFLVNFGLKFKELQEEKTAVKVLNQLDETFSSLQGTQFKTSSYLNIPIRLNVQCGTLSVQGKSKKTENLIFSQKVLQGDVLIGFNSYKMPFKIANFFYIIKEEDTYSFVYDNSNEKEVKEIAKNFKSYFPDNTEITDNPKNKVKVYFKQSNNADVVVSQEKVFYKDGSVDYYNEAMLYGAIVSKDNAKCLFEKTEGEKKKVIEIYKQKIESLPLNCNYQPILTSLQRLENVQSREIKGISANLESQNKALLNEDCPVVF